MKNRLANIHTARKQVVSKTIRFKNKNGPKIVQNQYFSKMSASDGEKREESKNNIRNIKKHKKTPKKHQKTQKNIKKQK